MRHNKGILLLCLGGKYVGWAVNYCASLRHFNNTEPIRIVCDSEAHKGLQPYAPGLEVELVRIAAPDVMNRSGRFSPGWAKLNAVKYVPETWQRVLFSDIDSLCTGSIEAIWNETGAVRSALTGKYAPDAVKWNCQWMPLDEVRKRYELNPNAPLLETNSSLFLFDREAGMQLYEKARENYDHNWRKSMWGGTFPDELAINVALNQLGIDYEDLGYMDFGSEPNRPILAFYGGVNFQQRRHTDKYDRYANAAFRGLFSNPTPYKFQIMIKQKHVQGGAVQNKMSHDEVIFKNNIEAMEAHIAPHRAVPIRSQLLLPDTGFGAVTCYTNMGLIRHYGKYIAAIRTEQPPYWKNSRVILVELDPVTLQPTSQGKVLDLNGHSEDARLYRNGSGGVSIAYTDGQKQFKADMVQGEAVNHKELKRGGGYSLPDSDGREKNWMPICGTDLFVCNIGSEGLIVSNGEGNAVRICDGINWDFGHARGSTPIVPLPDGGYIGLFHSKLHNRQFDFSQYYVGGFVLDADLRLIWHSKKPLLVPPFEPKHTPRPAWKIACVFPCGLSIVGNDVIISAGENDFRSVTYRLGLGELLTSVKEVALY